MNYMTYCWTQSGLDSCQKVGAVIAHLLAGESKALLASLPTWDLAKRIHSSSPEENRVRAHSKASQGKAGTGLCPEGGQGGLRSAVPCQVENSPMCRAWGGRGAGTRRGVITNCKAWLNDGILTWDSCLKMENGSSSDFVTRTVRFLGFWKHMKVCDGNKMPHSKSGSWQRIATLSVTQNWKQQNFLQFCLLVYKCCKIQEWNMLKLNWLQQRSCSSRWFIGLRATEICYPLLLEEGEGRETQMKTQGLKNKKRAGKSMRKMSCVVKSIGY